MNYLRLYQLVVLALSRLALQENSTENLFNSNRHVVINYGNSYAPHIYDLNLFDDDDCELDDYKEVVNNGWCDSKFFKDKCTVDKKDCEGWCRPECKPGWVGDGVCDLSCFNEECNWDGGDCDVQFQRTSLKTKSANTCKCPLIKLGDGVCDFECNNPECDFDKGDCSEFCSKNCRYSQLGNGTCDTSCFTEQCGFDKGDCKECAPGCRPDRIGNGLCDLECMNDKCFWDMGDCAGFCKIHPFDYSAIPFVYKACRKEWISDGFCDCACFNEECDWDGHDCDAFDCSFMSN